MGQQSWISIQKPDRLGFPFARSFAFYLVLIILEKYACFKRLNACSGFDKYLRSITPWKMLVETVNT
jgi:hypothetical protein